MLHNIEKKTKIIATIGPATDNPKSILELYKAGMNVMRINFSHGDYAEQLNKIVIARDYEKQGIYIPVALDTKGPEIRTGLMKDGKVSRSRRPNHAHQHEKSFRGRGRILRYPRKPHQ